MKEEDKIKELVKLVEDTKENTKQQAISIVERARMCGLEYERVINLLNKL